MNGKIIMPPSYEKVEGPVIFLAGPIQGADKWQDEAIKIIHNYNPEINIANPRRNIKFTGEFPKELYNEQVDWETHHLNRAGENGTVLFWLAKEFEHKCYRAYAQTSRFELAEWKEKHINKGANLVVGIEEGFTGAKYIQRRFPQDCPDVPICPTLEETCKKAVELALK